MNENEKFEITDEGDIDKYLGDETHKRPDDTHELKQYFLIKRIIEELNMSMVDA